VGWINKKSRGKTICFLMAGFYRWRKSDTRLPLAPVPFKADNSTGAAGLHGGVGGSDRSAKWLCAHGIANCPSLSEVRFCPMRGATIWQAENPSPSLTRNTATSNCCRTHVLGLVAAPRFRRYCTGTCRAAFESVP
jgi:hypothetical protein